MVKPYFTRKNLIVIALTFFYALLVIFCGVCIDGAHAIIPKGNIINIIGQALSLQSIAAGTAGFVTLILLGFYLVVFVAAFLYERRYALVNGKKPYKFGMIIAYFFTFVLCIALSLGVGLLIQRNLGEDIWLLLRFISNAALLGTMIYAVLFGLVAFGAMLIINFLFVDKPFKFWNKKETISVGEEIEEVDSDITTSFDVDPAELQAAGLPGAGGIGSGNSSMDLSNIKKVEELDDREKVFPALSAMDIRYEGYAVEKMETVDITLEELVERFRNYLAVYEQLYFDKETIRIFISAFAASHFMILEGLSGTGKSSLPRYFAKFIKANLLFVPVQTTWRDKTSILGYFNDFSKTYNETDFLLNLYHANYNPDQMHIFVLDEMNISRVEYYFADLLSVLEYPVPDWRLRLLQIPHGFLPPAKLDDGFIQIPENSFFVGTANKDDSTFVITDKVYDRAITIDFDYRNKAFKVDGESAPISLSFSKLKSLYEEALSIDDNKMTEEDYEKFETITDFIYEKFDLTFGNRILNQIETLVPTYIACGGKKEEVLDFLLTRKVLAKLEGRFEEYVKPSLKQLLVLIHKTYGSKAFARSEKAINAMIRRL
jgi:MoxR-like ATPase